MLVGSKNAELQLVLGLGGGGECGPLWGLQNEGEGSTQVKLGKNKPGEGAHRAQDREAQGEGALATGNHLF